MAKFSFLIHPLDHRDVIRNIKGIEKYLTPLIYNSPYLYEKIIMPRLDKICSKKISDISGVVSKTGQILGGIYVGIPYTTEQLYDKIKKKELEEIITGIEKARKISEEEGCDIIGLGAHTSIVSNGGQLLKREGIPITTGNTYTAISAIEAAYLGAEILENKYNNYPLVIIGGAGSIGSLSAVLLAEKAKEIRLCGRTEKKLREMKEKIENYLKKNKKDVPDYRIFLDAKEAVKGCKIVISATNNIEPIFNTKQEFDVFESGCVISDVARPTSIDKKIIKYRNDVLVIDAGIIDVPGKIYSETDTGFPKGKAYACMSETMIMALEGIRENWTERLLIGFDERVRRARIIKTGAEKHGFKVSALRQFNRPLNEEKINEIKKNSKK